MQQQALSAIVAWVRLDSAIQSFNQALRREFGITGLQLAVLRILGERPALPLAALRKSLVMHPATLGQSIDELRVMELCTVTRDARDKRARIVAITDKGRELMARAPLAGPVRLVSAPSPRGVVVRVGEVTELHERAHAFRELFDSFAPLRDQPRLRAAAYRALARSARERARVAAHGGDAVEASLCRHLARDVDHWRRQG